MEQQQFINHNHNLIHILKIQECKNKFHLFLKTKMTLNQIIRSF